MLAAQERISLMFLAKAKMTSRPAFYSASLKIVQEFEVECYELCLQLLNQVSPKFHNTFY